MPKQPNVKANDPNRIDQRKKRTGAFDSVAQGGPIEKGMEFTPESPNLIQNNTGMDTMQVGKTYAPIGQVAAGTELANLLQSGMAATTAGIKGYGYVQDKKEQEEAEQKANYEALQKQLEQNKIDKTQEDQEHDTTLDEDFRARVLELQKRIAENPSDYDLTRRHEEMTKIYDMYPDTGFRTKRGRIQFEEKRIEHEFKRGEAHSSDWYYENVDQHIARLQASTFPDAEKYSLIVGVVDRAIEAAESDPELLKEFPRLKSNLQSKLGSTWDTHHARAARESKTMVQSMGPALADAYALWVQGNENSEFPLEDYKDEDDPVGALIDDLAKSANIDLGLMENENSVRDEARELMQPKLDQLRKQIEALDKAAVKNRLTTEAKSGIIDMQSPDFSLEGANLDKFAPFSGTILALRNTGETGAANTQFEDGIDQIIQIASTRTIDFGGTEPDERRAHMHATFRNMLSSVGIVVEEDENGDLILEDSGLAEQDVVMIKSIQNKINGTDFDVIGNVLAGKKVEEMLKGANDPSLPIYEQRVLAHGYAKQIILDAGPTIATRLIESVGLGANDIANRYVSTTLIGGTVGEIVGRRRRPTPRIDFNNPADVGRLNRIVDKAIANTDMGQPLLESLREEVKSFYSNVPQDEQGGLWHYGPEKLEALLEYSIAGDDKLGNLLLKAETVLNKDHSVSTSSTDLGKLREAVTNANGTLKNDGSGYNFDTRNEDQKVLDAFRLANVDGQTTIPTLPKRAQEREAYYAQASQGLGKFSDNVRTMSPEQIFRTEETFFMRMGATLAPLLGQPGMEKEKREAIKGFMKSRYLREVSDLEVNDLVTALAPGEENKDNLTGLLARTVSYSTDESLRRQTKFTRQTIKVTGGVAGVNVNTQGDPLEDFHPLFILDALQATSHGDTNGMGAGEISIDTLDELVLGPRGMELTFKVGEVMKRRSDLEEGDVVKGFGALPRLAGPDDGIQVIAAGSNQKDENNYSQGLNINKKWSQRLREYVEEESVAERALFEEVHEDGQGGAIHAAWTQLMTDIADGNPDVIRDMDKIYINNDTRNYYDQLRYVLFAAQGYSHTLESSKGNLKLGQAALVHSLLRKGTLPHELIHRAKADPLGRGRTALYHNPEKAIQRDEEGNLLFVFGDQVKMESGIEVPTVWNLGNGFIQDVHRGHLPHTFKYSFGALGRNEYRDPNEEPKRVGQIQEERRRK
jgi:hypothetical protein